MEKELEIRIAELKEFCDKEWETFEMRDVAKEKLARLELLYKDLTSNF